MEENTNANIAEEQTEEEKKFTQDEVNEIVKKRLQRERDRLEDEYTGKLKEATATADDDLIRRETAVACKEYLIDNHYPLELLDILGADDVTEFQKKVDQLDGLLQPSRTAPTYQAEPAITGRDSIRSAFSPDARHKPKGWY